MDIYTERRAYRFRVICETGAGSDDFVLIVVAGELEDIDEFVDS